MTVSRRLAFGAAALPLALSADREARAQTAAPSALDAAIKRGSLIVGTSLSSPPFGIVDANMQPDGYDVGIAKLLARELGVKPDIQDIVASNRIPSLTSGKVDIVISSFSITAERAKAIAFTNCVYVDQQVMLGPKSVQITGIEDLKGKIIGVTRSTTNDIAVTRHAPEGTQIQRYDDDAATNQAILAGQVQGMVTSAGGAYAIREHNPTLETKFIVSEAPMGIGLRHGDADLLHWLNTTLFMLWTNKEIQPLQQKWMGGANTDLPRYS